jgi:DNA-binding CsgD family transcriptional regulator
VVLVTAEQKKSLEPKINRYILASALNDYHWMMNSIKLLRDAMTGAGERVVRQYGPDSDMPKAQGGSSDPVYQEFLRREKRWSRIREYEDKVLLIQERMHIIKDQRETEVLHWLLEGKSFRWIGLHMGLSHSHIGRIREEIVTKLLEAEPDVPYVPKVPVLKKQKK